MALFRREARVTRAELAAWAEVQVPDDNEDAWTAAIRPIEPAGRQPYDTGRAT